MYKRQGYGYADLDSVKVYNVVLSDAEIGEELNSVAQLEYYLDGKNSVSYTHLDVYKRQA